MSGLTDPIADMLTRIRNAGMARHPNVLIPASNIKVAVARVMKEERFIRDYEFVRGQRHPTLRVHLLYNEQKEPMIKGIQRVSKPGRRVYVGKGSIPDVQSGLGVAVVTTPQGLMTGQKARQLGVGGEVLCQVW